MHPYNDEIFSPMRVMADAAYGKAEAAFQDRLHAGLTIMRIWPDAFKHGRLTVGGKLAVDCRHRLAFIEYHFKNDKKTYWLAAHELKTFMPDAVIHPTYNDRYLTK